MSIASVAVAAFLLPPVTFAVVEANARTVRDHTRHEYKYLSNEPQQQQQPQPTRLRRSNERSFQWIIDRASARANRSSSSNNDGVATRNEPQQSENQSPKEPFDYQTYEQSVVFLGEAIARDREQKEKPSALDRPLEGIYTDKPVLRGQFHKWGAILYPPLLGIPLLLKARSSPRALEAALIFNFAVESILVISARLHTCQWKTLGSFQNARFMDFAAIFFGIACFYSSMGRLLMEEYHPVLWRTIEGVVWLAALAGTFNKWNSKNKNTPPVVNGIVFLVQGWATLPCIPSLWANSSWKITGGLLGGAYFGTLGALAYVFQWPNHCNDDTKCRSSASKLATKPQREIIFGPHEMFHVGTLFLFVSFWFAMWFKISELV